MLISVRTVEIAHLHNLALSLVSLNHKCDAFQELPMTRAGIMSSTPLDSPATSPGTMCSPTEQAKGLSSTLTCSGIGSGEESQAQPRTLIPQNYKLSAILSECGRWRRRKRQSCSRRWKRRGTGTGRTALSSRRRIRQEIDNLILLPL